MPGAGLSPPLSGLWAVPTCLVMPAETKHLTVPYGQVFGVFGYGQKHIC